MYIIYRKEDGVILKSVISSDIKEYIKLNNYTNHGCIETSKININESHNYKVVSDRHFELLTDIEKNEIRQYSRILTSEERRLNSMTPPQEEIQKAENTIEILTLLSEVL